MCNFVGGILGCKLEITDHHWEGQKLHISGKALYLQNSH